MRLMSTIVLGRETSQLDKTNQGRYKVGKEVGKRK